MKQLCLIVGLLLTQNASAALSDEDIVREGCAAHKTPARKSQCNTAVDRLLGKPSNSAIKGAADSVPPLKAQARVTALLRDPESARFRSTNVSPSTKAICGTVSAKNAHGGYGDPMRFIVTEDQVLLETTEAWKMDIRWQELCPEF
jgi:hypothetical protein